MGIFLSYDDMFEHRMHGSSVGIAKIHDRDCYWYGAGWYSYIESMQSWSSLIAEHPGDLMRQIYFWPLAKSVGKILTPEEASCLPPEPSPYPSDYAARRGAWSMSRPSLVMRIIKSQKWYDDAMVDWIKREPYADIARRDVVATTPEPSPQDRALDEFIARRVAKRGALVNRSGIEPATDAEAAEYRRRGREYENGKALDRAMSQLGPHDTDIHTRLMPHRLESKS